MGSFTEVPAEPTTATRPTPATRRRAGVRLTAAALLTAATMLLVPGLPAGAQDEPSPTDAALAWMQAELDTFEGTLPGWLEGTVDWGLMGDFALARIATGHGEDTATRELAQRLLDNLGTYSTWDDQGPDFAGVRVAGALAKVYLVAIGAGLDTSDVDGVDLEAEMRSLMNTTGDQVGRFSDRNAYGPDYSLGLGQAWAMMALAHTSEGVPAQAVSFLVDQQCPGGGFRLVYDGTPGCTEDSEADPDATALAVQVLLGLQRDQRLESSLSDAIGYLLPRQQPDGSFGGGAFTEAPNANSTGLIVQSLRAAGSTGAADLGSAWIAQELQLGAGVSGTPAEPDSGAIAYDPQSRAGALAAGIADQGRDQWRRATSQGVLGLGAGLLVEVIETEVPPDTGTSTTSSTSTSALSSAVTPDSTTSSVPATAVAAGVQNPSEPTQGGSAEEVAVAGEQVSQTTSSGSSTTATSLAATGTDTSELASVAMALLVAGLLAAGVGTRITRGSGWRP